VDLPEKVDAVLKEERLSPRYFEGLDHLVNSNNQLEEAWGLYLRARDLVVQGASVASLPMIERSEILFRANGNNAGLSKILLLKAHSYWALGSGEEILSTSEEAMALRQDDALAWATAAGNYSTYLIDFGYYQKALEYSDTVLSIFKSMHGKINPSEAYAVRAEAVYQLNRDPLEADTLIQASMALVDDDRVVDIDKQNIYFRALGMAALSQEQIAECIRFAHQREYWSLEAQARSQLANYNLLGETKDEALNAEIMANKLALQRVDESQSKFLAFELDRGKRERLRFEEAARLRQQTLLIFLSMALVVIIGVWISYRSILKTKEAQFDVQEAQLELESYKNRIRPHFLFNQLNNVNGFLNQERLQEAQEYLAELSQFLRSLLYDQNSNLVQFQYEVRHLEKYASLQQQSSYGHVNFTVNVSDELLKSKIPSGILQPLVENSFKYAGNSSLPEPWVKVSACQIGPSQLEIRVEDSGFGSMERVPGTGNGLTLVKNRIAFNKGRSSFPKLWEIETNFGKRKSTVKLTMPSKLV
jgi:two-component sensor histidine kinase